MATSSFHVYGPYPINRDKVFEGKWRSEAWGEVDEEEHGLSYAQGAYLFSLRNKGNYKPLYVGITHKQDFRREVLGTHNLLKIAKDWKSTKGTICVHLLAKPKSSHSGFSVRISPEELKWLEVMLIFSGRRKNPDLLNKKHMKFLDSVQINHVTGREKIKGKRPDNVRSFLNAIDW